MSILVCSDILDRTSGYENKTLDFTPELLKALDFVDSSFAQIISKLKQKDVYEDTLIIVASKHGQAPIDPTKYGKVDPSLVPAATGVNVSFTTTDDIALIFLENSADTDTAVAGLNKARFDLRIADIIYGPRLIAEGFGDPTKDPAVPNIIVRPIEGIIYTTSTAKIAEHGGLNEDDRHVACFAHAQHLRPKTFTCPVSTRQVGPTILKVLGLKTGDLQGAKAEGTPVLDGFTDSDGD